MKRKTKKIAIIYSGARYWGGIESYLESLFRNVDKDKFELTLVSLGDWPLVGKLGAAGFNTKVFSKKRVNPATIANIRVFIRYNRFDLIISQGTVANFYGRLVSLCTGVPSLVTVHSDLFYDYPNPFTRTFYLIVERLTRFQTKYYIAVSEYLKEKLVKSGIKNKNISVIYNGVVPPSMHSMSKGGIDGPVIIGTVGRLHKVKNYRELIHGVSNLSTNNYQLRIVGEGDEKKYLERLINELNLSKQVKLVGSNNVKEQYAGFNIYIQPSLSEGFGLTVIEAMMAGNPVIVSPHGALPELIKNGETGIVMKGSNRVDITTALDYMIQHMDDAKRIAISGKKFALNRFGSKRWISETEKVICEILK